MSEEKDDDKVTACPDGWNVLLRFPEPGKRTSVKVKALRVADLRTLVQLEDKTDDEDADLFSAVGEFLGAFTDLNEDEYEAVALEDMATIREVVHRQAKKILTG